MCVCTFTLTKRKIKKLNELKLLNLGYIIEDLLFINNNFEILIWENRKFCNISFIFWFYIVCSSFGSILPKYSIWKVNNWCHEYCTIFLGLRNAKFICFSVMKLCLVMVFGEFLYFLGLAQCFIGLSGITARFFRSMENVVKHSRTVEEIENLALIPKLLDKKRSGITPIADITLLAFGTSFPQISITDTRLCSRQALAVLVSATVCLLLINSSFLLRFPVPSIFTMIFLLLTHVC